MKLAVFADKFLRMDRRLIFPPIAVAIIIPMLFPLHLRVSPSPPVLAVYRTMEKLPAGTPVLISMDYDPSTTAELSPMAVALFRQCYARHLPIVVMTLDPGGAGLAVQLLHNFARETGAKEGIDYTFLGYKAGIDAVVLAWGQDVEIAFPTDYNNTPLDKIPLMDHARSYRDVGLVITLAAASYPEVWVPFAHERYGAPIAAGVTAVMAPDYYPYLQTGQLIGMLGGLKGAAEYEGLTGRPGDGMKGMDAQTMVHLFVVLIIVLGNAAYFITLRVKKREGAA